MSKHFRPEGTVEVTPVGKRKTVRVIREFESSGSFFSAILIKGKEIKFELAGISSYPSSSYRGSTL